MQQSVYLDNAASTPMLPQALEAMLPWLGAQYGNPSSVHQAGRSQRAAIEKARKTVAELIGASPSEIVFTSGGTEADNLALCGSVYAGGIQALVSSPLEHHAVLHTLEHLAHVHQLPLHWLPNDGDGRVDLAALEALLARTPGALVSLMHGNNETGTLIDIAHIAELCRKYGAIYHTDTVQTMGHLPIHAETSGVHYLTASAHKFGGPRGTGFLYRRGGTAMQPHLHGGGQERNQRAGTENVAGIMGLAAALELSVSQMQAHAAHCRGLKDQLMNGLKAIVPGVSFNGDTTPQGSLDTVLNVAFPSDDEESLLLFNFDIAGICVSGGSACTSGSVHPSHVLAAMGCSQARMANSIRFSFGPQNTAAEIDYVLTRVAGFVPQLAGS